MKSGFSSKASAIAAMNVDFAPNGPLATRFAEMGHPLEKEADDGAGVR